MNLKVTLEIRQLRLPFDNSELDFTMAAAAAAFENILQTIQYSNLNFLLELSPFAATISLKKTPVKNKSGIALLPCVPIVNSQFC